MTFLNLSDELLLHVTSYLGSPRAWGRLSCTCKTLYFIANDKQMWRDYVCRNNRISCVVLKIFSRDDDQIGLHPKQILKNCGWKVVKQNELFCYDTQAFCQFTNPITLIKSSNDRNKIIGIAFKCLNRNFSAFKMNSIGEEVIMVLDNKHDSKSIITKVYISGLEQFIMGPTSLSPIHIEYIHRLLNNQPCGSLKTGFEKRDKEDVSQLPEHTDRISSEGESIIELKKEFTSFPV